MDPVVFIPGLIATERLFAAQIRKLGRDAGIFLAAHGLDSSMAKIAGRLLANAPPRFALVGLSMGGYVALEVVRQAPDRVARLVLMDTSARPDSSEQTENRRRQIALARAGRFRDIPDAQFPLAVHEARAGDTDLLEIVRDMAMATGPDAFERQQTAIIGRVDSRPFLPAIACPTLVVVGAGDRLTPPPLAEEIAGGIPHAQLAVVAGAGHLSTLEAPEPTAALLFDFLSA